MSDATHRPPPRCRFLWPAFCLTVLACGGSQESAPDASQAEAAAPADSVMIGEEAVLLMANDSSLMGLAVLVRQADGSQVQALFRGPQKLADVSTDGTFVFDAESLPVRVRVLKPGESLTRPPR